MADTFTSLDRLVQPQVGGDGGTWGNLLNLDMSLIEQIHDGIATISASGGGIIIATTSNGATDQARCGILLLNGTPSGAYTLQLPATTWARWIINATGQTVTVTTGASSSSTVIIAANSSSAVYSDGTNVKELASQVTNLVSSNVNISGGVINNLTLDGGSF